MLALNAGNDDDNLSVSILDATAVAVREELKAGLTMTRKKYVELLVMGVVFGLVSIALSRLRRFIYSPEIAIMEMGHTGISLRRVGNDALNLVSFLIAQWGVLARVRVSALDVHHSTADVWKCLATKRRDLLRVVGVNLLQVAILLPLLPVFMIITFRDGGKSVYQSLSIVQYIITYIVYNLWVRAITFDNSGLFTAIRRINKAVIGNKSHILAILFTLAVLDSFFFLERLFFIFDLTEITDHIAWQWVVRLYHYAVTPFTIVVLTNVFFKLRRLQDCRISGGCESSNETC